MAIIKSDFTTLNHAFDKVIRLMKEDVAERMEHLDYLDSRAGIREFHAGSYILPVLPFPKWCEGCGAGLESRVCSYCKLEYK